MQETRVRSLGQKDPLEKEMATHPSLLSWRIPQSLVGYSPWGHEETDSTEMTKHAKCPVLFNRIKRLTASVNVRANVYIIIKT